MGSDGEELKTGQKVLTVRTQIHVRGQKSHITPLVCQFLSLGLAPASRRPTQRLPNAPKKSEWRRKYARPPRELKLSAIVFRAR
mmetsp:Transcript_107939/g.168712  ORF Transcript_107939/g.168712 Transcript_107939/m.168712 type:complete len:84 (+) Transcript_107939:51-302(+)